tara:strand:- start:1412 stop:1996 length:585 start_codon:yes stop_codon:yes gene_type:complete
LALLFVTGNEHKFDEVSAMLKSFDIELHRKSFDFIEPPLPTLKAIALSKAEQAFEKFKVPLIVEDTGIYFKAYNNFPGTEPKRAFNALGHDGLLRLLKGKNREVFFHTVICFYEGQNAKHFFEGKLEGKATTKVIKPNANVMPYEKIFIPKGEKRSLAEIPRSEKNVFSHRAIATHKLGKWLKEKALDDLLDSI